MGVQSASAPQLSIRLVLHEEREQVAQRRAYLKFLSLGLALRGAAVGGIRILLPNPSNHFQLSWTEKCTRERDRRKMVGQVGQVGHDSVSLDTPTPHRHISHDRVRRRGVGSRATGNRRSGRFYALRASVGHYRYTIHRVCTLLLGRGGLTLTPHPHPPPHRPSPSPLTLTLNPPPVVTPLT